MKELLFRLLLLLCGYIVLKWLILMPRSVFKDNEAKGERKPFKEFISQVFEKFSIGYFILDNARSGIATLLLGVCLIVYKDDWVQFISNLPFLSWIETLSVGDSGLFYMIIGFLFPAIIQLLRKSYNFVMTKASKG